MASKGKGKDKIKLKKHEIELDKKVIDLKRFAYDVMKYTALKFRVPESCIAVWDGQANDYGHDDFCSAVCRRIILTSLADRYRYYAAFRKHYERNKLATQDLINRLLQEVMNKEMDKFQNNEQLQVGVSLSVLCELFLFLYSEDINLCPKQLATHWFHCYLNIYKKQFENAGGLKEMYCIGSIKNFDDVDEFVNQFIEDHCLPYKTTASNPGITVLFIKSFQKRIQESKKDTDEIEGTVESVAEMVKREHPNLELRKVTVVPPDEASGINVPPNTDFGIPHDKLLQLLGPSVAPPQDPPAASPKGKSRHRRRLSHKQRIKMEIEDDGVDLLANPGLGVPLPHEMYDFDFPVDASQSQELLEVSKLELSTHTKRSPHGERSRKRSSRASIEKGFGQPSSDSPETKKPIVTRTPPKGPSALSPEEQPQHRGTLSSKQRMKMMQSSLCANMEQGLEKGFGQPSSDSPETKKPIVTRTPPKGPSALSPEEQPQHHGTLSSKQRMKMKQSSLCANTEQGLEQLISDAYEMKQLSRKTPNPPRTPVSSQDPSATSPEEQPRFPKILTEEEAIMKMLSVSDDESPVASKREETLGGDLPSNTDLGVPHGVYDFLLANADDISEYLTDQIIQEPSKPAGRSCRKRRNRKPRFRASVEQGLAQPSSDSSRTEASPKDPFVTSSEQQSRRPGIGDEEIAKILSICKEESLTSKRGETSEIDLSSNPGLGEPLPQEMYDFPLVDVAEPSQNLLEEHIQETSKHARRLSHREKSDRKPSLRASVEQELEQPCSTLQTLRRLTTARLFIPRSETKNLIFTRTVTPPKGLAASSPEEQSRHHRASSYQQKMVESGLRANVEQDLGQPSSDSYEMKQSSRKTPSVSRTLVPPQDPSATSPEETPRHPRNLTDEQIAKILRNLTDEEISRLLSISEEPPITSERNETSEVDLPSNPGLGVPLPEEVYESPLIDVAELSHNLPEDHVHETTKHARRISDLERKLSHLERRLSHLERRDGKPSSRAREEQGLEQPRSDSSETKNPIVTRSVASPKDSFATSPDQPKRPGIGGEKIAKILSISEEESLASKQEETTGVDLPSNHGLGQPLPQERYYFPFPVEAAQTQKLPEELVQEISKHARRLSSRERRDRKPSSRAGVVQGLEQPSSDSLETKNPIVTRILVSPKGPAASISEEQFEYQGILSNMVRLKMIEYGLIESVPIEPILEQSSSDSAITTDATQSYERHRDESKVPAPYREACGLKTGEYSLCFREEPDLGQSSSDSATATDTTQSYKCFGAKPKIRVENTGSSWFAESPVKSREEREKEIQKERKIKLDISRMKDSKKK